MALIQSTAIPSGATDYELEQSLKLNGAGYLAKTPSSGGNRKTSTFSTWVKITPAAATGGQDVLFEAYEDNANRWSLFIGDNTTNYIGVFGETGDSTDVNLATNVSYRDYSAWYHIMFVLDTTQGTATNRAKLYVNGEQVTSFSTATYPSQNDDLILNKNVSHHIGAGSWSGSIGNYYLNGYMSETHFIDGQALTPADFGETGDYGEWKPIEYSGTYGTNGFYLPFKQDYSVEGFSTVTYKGNGASQYIGGTGFQPDLTWIKSRSYATDHQLYDSVRGATKVLEPHTTGDESTQSTGLTAFDTDGFSLGSQLRSNTSGQTYVAWNWDMGGSNASNTDGSITSTVRANPTYGQSIVSWTNPSSSQTLTVGHGLGVKPDMIIMKGREEAGNWFVYHKDLATLSGLDEERAYLKLNSTDSTAANVDYWADSIPTTSLIATTSNIVGGNSKGVVAYCFASKTGYSKIDSYTGTGSTNAITTGFKPAFVMLKRTNRNGDSWAMFDNTRNPSNPVTKALFANASDAEYVEGNALTFTDTGFTLNVGYQYLNVSGGEYIYMAFADKREYAYWLDQSGNNNDWTSNNLTESDISVDSPTNNFATMNPIDYVNGTVTYSEGNLKVSAAGDVDSHASIEMGSGKWYWELLGTGGQNPDGNNGSSMLGIAEAGNTGIFWDPSTNGVAVYQRNGNKYVQAAGASFGSLWAMHTDIIGIAYDGTANTLQYFKNNVSMGTITGVPDVNYVPAIGGAGSYEQIANFGQDSSFAGNKTAQGNQDGNDIGDFYYTPPTGFLALCTSNLPDVAVTPSEHFNTILYTGDDSADRAITGVGFAPDFVWAKERSNTAHHVLVDSVRGSAGGRLSSNRTNAEDNGSGVAVGSFDSDGFTTGSSYSFLNGSTPFVAWNWKANGSGSSNTDGDITSTVSANTDAGFSIVSYTGTGSAATVGHGLSSAPELMIVKNRDEADSWAVFHNSLNTYYLTLDTNAAQVDNAAYWNDTSPTSTVFTVGTAHSVNANTEDYIAYCWRSVEGYSKVNGFYIGNASTDGVFNYCGFSPRWIMIKRKNAVNNWYIYDTERTGSNPTGTVLLADSSNAEATQTYFYIDILSNGWKARASDGAINVSGEYIYMAFAETPFKYSNAR